MLLPFAIFLCAYLPDWTRFKIAYGCRLGIIMVGEVALLSMYNPSFQYNQSFPFHAMTSAMMMEKGGGVTRGISGGLTTPGAGSGQGSDGRIVIKNSFDRQHVAELKALDRRIYDTIEALRHQSYDLRKALSTLDDGSGSQEFTEQPPPSRPLNMQSRFSSGSAMGSNDPNNGGYAALRSERGISDSRPSGFSPPAEPNRGPGFGPGPGGRPNFDDWWDDLNKKKPPNMPSYDLAPPSMRKERLPPTDSYGDRCGKGLRKERSD